MFWSPRRKVDGPLRMRLNNADRSDVAVTVVMRQGANQDAAAVRALGGTVLGITQGAHIIAARVPVGSVLPIAESRAVREIALERSSAVD